MSTGLLDRIRAEIPALWRRHPDRGSLWKIQFVARAVLEYGFRVTGAFFSRMLAPIRRLSPIHRTKAFLRSLRTVPGWLTLPGRLLRFVASLFRPLTSWCRRVIVPPVYGFVSRHFYTFVYPINFALSILWRNRKYENSVLHISYMVHIPYYASRIQRKHGMKADYLAVGGQSPWWNKFDYHFPRNWPPLFWQELIAFWKIVAKYEVIHAHFGITFSSSGWEIPHLKRMGRKIVVHYRGCEVRDPVVNKELHPDCNICQECDYNESVCREGKPRVEKSKAFGDAFLVTTPDMQDFEPDAIHIPFFTPEIDYEKYRADAAPRRDGSAFKIVHATNHPGIEGTAHIERAIDNLKARGYEIDFVFLRGTTPDTVLAEIQTADLTVGKMKMGYYANAQIESMFLGVPAITAVREEFMTPELADSGLIFCDIENLEATIAHYIDHPDELEAKRKIARSSILGLHDNDRLAGWLHDLYQGLVHGAAKGAAAATSPTDTLPTDSGAADAASARRPLRVLHIGNIANNAYYNAKFLRQSGVEADVLCYDDYWVMSSPEWEEVDFQGVPEDQFFPDWQKLGINGYERPRWFAQGPFDTAVHYLLAKQQSSTREADRLWREMAATRRRLCNPSRRRLHSLVQRFMGLMPTSLFKRLKERLRNSRLINYETGNEANFRREFEEKCQELIETFDERFPGRTDSLQLADLTPYQHNLELLAELFSYYDVIQGYATDPLYPMLAGFTPFIGFEHGTLRDAPEAEWDFKGPFHDNAIGRLTALSYSLASHVFITNADCVSSAKRLGLMDYSAMPHPLDDSSFCPTDEYRAEMRRLVGASVVMFCPIRHDWVDKGTDRYIRAIPALREALGDDFKVCFTPWGREVERSKALIAELGCEDQTMWIGPFGRVRLARWLSAADVVFDQVVYSSFSGITPRALACGVPVISSNFRETMEWMFPEPAPALQASTVEDIIAQTLKALDPEFRATNRVQAREWIRKYHSAGAVRDQLLDVYRACSDRLVS